MEVGEEIREAVEDEGTGFVLSRSVLFKQFHPQTHNIPPPKEKKNPQCISHHILCPQLPLCLCISSLAPDPVGSGESSSQGSAVWGARGC